MYRRWYSEFEEKKIPVFPDPGRMVRAAASLYSYSEFRKKG
jgi:acyl-CoA synthetase (NDP forming)